MVHFWFGFITAALVNVFHKLYVRIQWTRFWNDERQPYLGDDVTHFAGILQFIPSIALLILMTWFVSWQAFGNDYGFWIFWIYALLLGVNSIRLYDFIFPQNVWHDDLTFHIPSVSNA